MIILDSAHNRDSALKLRLTLDDYLPEKDVILVFGASEDKDVRGMLVDLMPRVEQRDCHTVHSSAGIGSGCHSRLCPPNGKKGGSNFAIRSMHSKKLIHLANGERAVLVAGSIFLAAAARELWLKTGKLEK